MTKLLTPKEVLQALIDGKKVEVYSEILDIWREIDPQHFEVDTLLDKEVKFRLPQEMIKLGGVSFPKPYKGEMACGQEYYVPNLVFYDLYSVFEWDNGVTDNIFYRRGLLHLSKENAIAHAQALIQLSGGNHE